MHLNILSDSVTGFLVVSTFFSFLLLPVPSLSVLIALLHLHVGLCTYIQLKFNKYPFAFKVIDQLSSDAMLSTVPVNNSELVVLLSFPLSRLGTLCCCLQTLFSFYIVSKCQVILLACCVCHRVCSSVQCFLSPMCLSLVIFLVIAWMIYHAFSVNKCVWQDGTVVWVTS